MAQIEIRLPKMGESVTEATITNWLKNIGDTVEIDEPLVEVATDKVDNELPSEAGGILIKQFFEKDQVAQVGDVIALISTDGADIVAETVKEAKVETTKVSDNNNSIQSVTETANPSSELIDKNGPSGKFYSPLVRSIAEKEGVSMAQLESINGTGQAGRVTKKIFLNSFKINHQVLPNQLSKLKQKKH